MDKLKGLVNYCQWQNRLAVCYPCSFLTLSILLISALFNCMSCIISCSRSTTVGENSYLQLEYSPSCQLSHVCSNLLQLVLFCRLQNWSHLFLTTAHGKFEHVGSVRRTSNVRSLILHTTPFGRCGRGLTDSDNTDGGQSVLCFLMYMKLCFISLQEYDNAMVSLNLVKDAIQLGLHLYNFLRSSCKLILVQLHVCTRCKSLGNRTRSVSTLLFYQLNNPVKARMYFDSESL